MAPGGRIWSRAAAVAAATPETRNRYVDFLRALSICAVVVGHWLIAAPYVSGGELSLSNMLEHQPWTRLLTWVFQVMPVFFIVGGYSNGVSWNAARRDGRPYGEWLRARLQRLVGPVLPLLALWVVLGVIANRLGMAPEMVAAGSQMALIPIWFLAVYVGVVVAAPLTYAAWERYGLTSVAALAVAVVIDDVLFFAAGFRAVGWLNYAFIWVAAHQLGYAWRDGYLSGPKLGLAWAIGGALLMVALVTLGPYPVSMVSVPGEPVSNTLPPKLPMLTLATLQIGLLLSVEAPMRRWLNRAAPWTATVLVNGMIMTVFLWHLTASTLVIAAAIWLGDVGLTVEPGSGAWWAARPLWLGLYTLGLVFFALVFMRFERGGGARTVAAWRQVVGAALVCAGLALLALYGIGGDGPLGLNLWVLLLPFVGAALAGVNPLGRAPARAAGLALWYFPFIGLAGCRAEPPQRLAQVRDSAGIHIVENADYSWPDGRGWRLSDEPLLDIGALEGDSSYQLYQVVGSQRLSDGRVAVANGGSFELRLYDAHGTHLLSTGREGGGPGEFGGISALASMTGDSLLVYDWRNRRVSVFGPGGALGRAAQLQFLSEIGGYPMIVAPFDDGSLLVGVRTYFSSGERRSGLSRDMIVYVHCDPEGLLLDTLAVLPGGELNTILDDDGVLLGDRPFGRYPRHAVYADGFYYGSSDLYEIRYYSRTGLLQRLIRRAIPNLEVTDRDIESYRRERLENAEDEMQRRVIERLLADDPFPQSFPAYGNLMADAEGNLWVTVYRRSGDVQPRWTVFDPSGQMLGVVSVPERFTVHQIGSDFVLGRWQDDLDVEHVRMYGLIKTR